MPPSAMRALRPLRTLSQTLGLPAAPSNSLSSRLSQRNRLLLLQTTARPISTTRHQPASQSSARPARPTAPRASRQAPARPPSTEPLDPEDSTTLLKDSIPPAKRLDGEDFDSAAEARAAASPVPSPAPSSLRGLPGREFAESVVRTGGSAYSDANGDLNGNANANGGVIDWSSSFHGLSTTPFPADVAEVLLRPLAPHDVEIKPDGIIYLPEIKYRRILNAAFGPGGWGMAPRTQLVVGERFVSQEYALVVHGRFIAQARGECQYFSDDTIPTAGEGCKSNALMRCCKDLGIASELWDPRFIREFKRTHCHEVWVEHVVTKKRRQTWVRKDSEPQYPYKATAASAAAAKR